LRYQVAYIGAGRGWARARSSGPIVPDLQPHDRTAGWRESMADVVVRGAERTDRGAPGSGLDDLHCAADALRCPWGGRTQDRQVEIDSWPFGRVLR
jgi:hypothetical protein